MAKFPLSLCNTRAYPGGLSPIVSGTLKVWSLTFLIIFPKSCLLSWERYEYFQEESWCILSRVKEVTGLHKLIFLVCQRVNTFPHSCCHVYTAFIGWQQRRLKFGSCRPWKHAAYALIFLLKNIWQNIFEGKLNILHVCIHSN